MGIKSKRHRSRLTKFINLFVAHCERRTQWKEFQQRVFRVSERAALESSLRFVWNPSTLNIIITYTQSDALLTIDIPNVTYIFGGYVWGLKHVWGFSPRCVSEASSSHGGVIFRHSHVLFLVFYITTTPTSTAAVTWLVGSTKGLINLIRFHERTDLLCYNL